MIANTRSGVGTQGPNAPVGWRRSGGEAITMTAKCRREGGGKRRILPNVVYSLKPVLKVGLTFDPSILALSATSITTEARQVITVSFFGGERLFRFPPDSQQFDRFPPFIHPADRIRPLDPNFTIAMPAFFIILSSGAGILRQWNLVVKTMSHVEGANEKGTGKTEVRLYVTSGSCQPNFPLYFCSSQPLGMVAGARGGLSKNAKGKTFQ